LLGELQADEVASLSKAMEKDPELAALYERLKVTIELVRETKPMEEQAPLKLSAEKREKLLASFKTVAPQEFAKPRRVMDWLVPMAACVAIAGVMAALLLPALSSAKRRAQNYKTYGEGRYSGAPKEAQNRSIDWEHTTTVFSAPTTATTPRAPQKPAVGPVDSAPKLQFVLAPAETPPASGKQMPIVLPPKQEAAGPTVVAGQKVLIGDENIDQGAVIAGVTVTNGITPGATSDADAFNGHTSYRTISQLGTEDESGKLALNYKNVTNGFGQAFAVDSHNKAGAVTIDPESHNLIMGGDRDAKNGGELKRMIGNLDRPSGNAQAGVSYYTNLYGKRSTLADNGSADTGLGDLVLQNMEVASFTPTNEGMSVWGSSVGGTTNAAVVVNDSWNFPTGSTPNVGSLGRGKAAHVAGAVVQAGGTVMASGGTMPVADIREIENQRGALPSPEVMERAKAIHESNIQTAQLVQDGKLLYQLGRIDEAELKLKEALDRDPQNEGAQYYFSLAKQQQVQQVADARNVTSMNRMAQVETDWKDDSSRGKLSAPVALRTNSITTVTNWWNVAATTRGFYDDNLNTTAGAGSLQSGEIVAVNGRVSTNTLSIPNDKIVEYASAKEQLDNAKKWRTALVMRASQVETDVNFPRSTMVKVTDRATAASTEKPSLGQKIRGLFSSEVERSARIVVEQNRPDLGGIGTEGTLSADYEPYFLQTEFEAIKSHDVLGKVVDTLNLDGGDKSKRKAAEEKLKASLDLRPVRNTKYIDIGVSGEKPEEAARIANAVADAYREYRMSEFASVNAQGIQSLQQQVAEQDKKIQVAQAKVDALRKSLGIHDSAASLANTSEMMHSVRLNDLTSLRVQGEAEYNQQVALLQRLKGMDKATIRKTLPVAYIDTQLNDLLSEYNIAQQALIKLKLNYNPDHPLYKNAQASVEDLDHKIDARVAEVIKDLEAKTEYKQAYLAELRKYEAVAKQAEIDAASQMAEAFAHAKDSALPKPTVPPPTPQPEVLTRENAFSTFSLNVSDVSFKLAAASLEKGQMPEPASIRSEEFINAFDYRDPEAAPGVPIAFAAERARYPFAHNRELLRFSVKTAAAGRQAGRPLNIVLLLDNSGSMERADRVSIIREALRVLAGQLQASDTFSIVTFARTAQLRVDGIPGNQAAAASEEIAKLTPEGGTNLGEALDLAYETALHHYLANGDNRVVLLTDGAANLGDVNPDALKQKVEAHRQQGVALDCFGIGWEDYNDDLLEVLTRNGDGRYGFINKPEEADTEFVAQIAGALHVAAADVKVQVEFNPQRVTSYRQIGYAKHQLTKEQFRDNTVDAAEIAAQEAGNALYTIETNPEGSGSIATVRVRYKVPGTVEYREQAWDVPYTGSAVAMDQASPAMRLASTACAFSEWLATSPFASDVSTDELLKYLSGVPQVYGADKRPAKLEWMIRQAKSISGK